MFLDDRVLRFHMAKFKSLFEDYQDELKPVTPAETDAVQYTTNISLDQLVDRYLRQYEKEGVGGNSTTSDTHPMQERKASWRDDFFKILKEAPGDDPNAAPPGGGDAGMDAGLDMGGLGDMGMDDMGDESAPEEKPSGPEVLPPNLDVERFAELVFGLMSNYENLLDPKTTIMNRAEAFVAKNYSPRHAEKLKTFIQTKFGEGFKDRAREMPDAPAVGSMGDTSSFGVGGGGGGGPAPV